MTPPTKFLFILLLLVSQQWPIDGKSALDEESKNSRESRQLLFRYRFPWPGPVHFYDHGQFNYGNVNPYYQQRTKQEPPLVNSLSSDAVQWMRNLNQDEQESMMAWTLASTAVASLTQGRYSGLVPFNPSQFNGFPSPSKHFPHYGQQRTPFRPGSSKVQPEDSEARTFRLIFEVIRQVAGAIRNCQVDFFSPLIGRCRGRPTTTTTTPSTTTATTTTTTTQTPPTTRTTPSTTTTTTTTSTTPTTTTTTDPPTTMPITTEPPTDAPTTLFRFTDYDNPQNKHHNLVDYELL